MQLTNPSNSYSATQQLSLLSSLRRLCFYKSSENHTDPQSSLFSLTLLACQLPRRSPLSRRQRDSQQMAISYSHANPHKDTLVGDQITACFESMRLSVVIVQASHSTQEAARLTREFRKKRAQDPRVKYHSTTIDREETPDYANLVEHGSGVFIMGGGFVLTCAHVLDGFDFFEIRTFDEVGYRPVQLVHQDKRADLALLHLRDRIYDDRYVKLADDESVSVGMQLFSIHNSYNLPFSMTIGEVAYPCVDLKTVFGDQHCINSTRTCRLMRDIVDINGEDAVDPLLSGLDKCTRFVQINNLHAHQGGSGSPVFDSRGHLVALYFSMCGYMDFGIHVYHIRQFMIDANVKARRAHKGKGPTRASPLEEKTGKRKKGSLWIGGN